MDQEQEKYQPSKEEIDLAESSMSDEQREMTVKREDETLEKIGRGEIINLVGLNPAVVDFLENPDSEINRMAYHDNELNKELLISELGELSKSKDREGKDKILALHDFLHGLAKQLLEEDSTYRSSGTMASVKENVIERMNEIYGKPLAGDSFGEMILSHVESQLRCAWNEAQWTEFMGRPLSKSQKKGWIVNDFWVLEADARYLLEMKQDNDRFK